MGALSHSYVGSIGVLPDTHHKILRINNNTRQFFDINIKEFSQLNLVFDKFTAVVRLQYVNGCGKSTIKVRRKYAESKAHVRLKYGKSTVTYGKSTALYGKSTALYGNFFFGAYCT